METKICDLPEDVLLKILLRIPTKEAVATTIISKRWRYVWTMLPVLEYKDKDNGSICYFIEKSLQLHKAPILKKLSVKFGPRSPVDVNVNVGALVENAVNRGVIYLKFKLWAVEPTRFPKCLYTCDTLVNLTLSGQILVDVSFEARLSSLKYLDLIHVMYKNEASLFRLLSSSPVLEWLWIERYKKDNLKNMIVKVPSLTTLFYCSTWKNDNVEVEAQLEEGEEEDEDEDNMLFVIDSPALTSMAIRDDLGDYILIENMPCLKEADIYFVPNPDDMFLRSLYFVRKMTLNLTETMVNCCSDVKFSWLLELYFKTEESVDWMEPLMVLLKNSPKLTTLKIRVEQGDLPPTWKQPSSTPECLSSHLENFVWINYEGAEDEKKLVEYIFANSECLKTVDISILETSSNLEGKQKELESLPRISTTSKLLFHTQLLFY